MTMKQIFFSLLLALPVGISGNSTSADGTSIASALSSTRQNELKRLVRQDCGSCHGMSLKGGLGKSLLPADLKNFSTKELAQIILDGINGTPMPPWRGLLSDPEANWIAANLKAGRIKRGNQ